MSPLNVERNLKSPTRVGLYRIDRATGLIHHRKARRVRQPELCIKRLEIGDDVGIAIRIDNGNRLTRAVTDDASEVDVVHTVGVTESGRGISAGSGGCAGGFRMSRATTGML